MDSDPLISGPSAQDYSARLVRVEQYTAWLYKRHPGQVQAVCLYGSMAREEDGPFSDIELFAVIDTPGTDENYEWVYGPNKAEINVLGADVARAEARRVDAKWAVAKGQFLNARLLSGDPALLAELQDLARSVTDEEIRRVVSSVLVGELYEWIGKLRNAQLVGETGGMPMLAVQFCQMIAQLAGLVNRHAYSTSMRMLIDSLQLPGFPTGYAQLCQMVIDGRLEDPTRLVQAIEDLWAGVVRWAVELGVEVTISGEPELG